MDDLKATEKLRQFRQEELDSQKDAAERNRWGQFATPIELSVQITKLAKRLWGKRTAKVRFLDPAIGTGSFYSALQTVFPSAMIEVAAGVELDEGFAKEAKNLWTDTGLQITQADFTALLPPKEKFNLVLTNPPYVRHHHLGKIDKVRLKELVSDLVDVNLSGLAGLYCHFLLLCDAWLEDDALSFWLIPSEFMDVNYGTAVKDYLLRNVSLVQIHRFCPSDVQFADALVSSAVVVFKKSKPREDHRVTMSFGGSLLRPTHKEKLSIDELASWRKWTQLPKVNGNESNGTAAVSLGDLFSIKRGLATGDNKFFVLPRGEAKKKGVPNKYIKPILPSPRYLPQTEIEGDESGYPKINNPLALIDCDLSEEDIARLYPRFWEYLSEGKEHGIDKKYLTSRRRPWYSQEHRDPAPFVCTYMGRTNNGTKPFRFIWNKSDAVAANVYLLLYPKGRLKAALDENPSLYLTVFEFLQGIGAHEFIGEGRVYGGGLHKMEPKELSRVSAVNLVRKIESLQIEKQATLF